jgi:hypothetical protein
LAENKKKDSARDFNRSCGNNHNNLPSIRILSALPINGALSQAALFF